MGATKEQFVRQGLTGERPGFQTSDTWGEANSELRQEMTKRPAEKGEEYILTHRLTSKRFCLRQGKKKKHQRIR